MNQLEKIVNDLEKQIQIIDSEISYKRNAKHQNNIELQELKVEKGRILDEIKELKEDRKLFKHRFLKGFLIAIFYMLVFGFVFWSYDLVLDMMNIAVGVEIDTLSSIDFIKMLFSWEILRPDEKYYALCNAMALSMYSVGGIVFSKGIIKEIIQNRKTRNKYESSEALEQKLDKKEKRDEEIANLQANLMKDNQEIDQRLASLAIERETLIKKLDIAKSYLESYELSLKANPDFGKGLNIDIIITALQAKLRDINISSEDSLSQEKLIREKNN